MDEKDQGWVKLHRKIKLSQVWKNAELYKVFSWCLLKANHSEQWVSVKTGRGETMVHIKPGQFIFGRLTASQELNMKPSSVRNRMAKLKKMRNVDMQPDTHCTIVTVCNWSDYQSPSLEDGQDTGQPKDNQRTTKGQPKDTDKKVKNADNGKKPVPKPETKQEAAARAIIDAYIALVARDEDSNTEQTRKNVEKLLKAGHTEQQLLDYAKNYAASPACSNDAEFRYKASNFYGRAGYWKAHQKAHVETFQRPDPVRAAAESAAQREITRGPAE